MRKSFLMTVTVLVMASLTYAETGSELPSAQGLSAAEGRALPSVVQPGPAMVIVPAETEAEIQLLSGIHSSVSHVGDPFAAQLVRPISVGAQVVIPAGSLIDGCITYIRPSGRLRRSAELGLRFELVTLPDGQNQPISALLMNLEAFPRTNTAVDSEGVLKGTGAGTWKRLTGGLLGLGAFSAIHAQIASAAALGISLPVGGGAVLGYTFLIPKGNDVHLPPDTQMRIRLRQPLTLRVAW